MDKPLTATEWAEAAFTLFCVIIFTTWLAYEIGRAINKWFSIREWRRTSLPPPSRDADRAFSHKVGSITGYRK